MPRYLTQNLAIKWCLKLGLDIVNMLMEAGMSQLELPLPCGARWFSDSYSHSIGLHHLPHLDTLI